MIITKLNLNFLIRIFFIIFLFQVADAANTTTINNLRLIEADNKISMIFDASKTLEYSLEQSPSKISITIKNAKLTALLNKTWLVKTPVATIASKQIGKNLHLTLKLKNSVKLKHDQLKKPARLILDFAIINTESPSRGAISRTKKNLDSDADSERASETAQAAIVNEEKIDQIEQQITLQIANRPVSSRSSETQGEQKNLDITTTQEKTKKLDQAVELAASRQTPREQLQSQNETTKIKSQDNETKVKSQNDSASAIQEIASNSSQESTDTVNIISIGSNVSINKTRDIIIVIDPGHGGEDPGAIGFSGVQEKDINLAVSKYLQKIINTNKGFKAILTRDSDCFIELRERLGIAHRYKADMFVSIHADAYISETAHGVSVFALSQKGATSEAARFLAKKENESELGRNISNKNTSLKSVLVDLAQAATISASLEIGQSLLRGFNQFAHLHSRKVEQAAFVVLKSPDIPSLLVETGFISDPHEESRLRDSKYQQKIASCLALGVTEYFTSRPPRGTYLAKLKK